MRKRANDMRALAGLSVLAGSLAVLALYLRPPTEYLAESWRSELPALPDEQAQRRLQQVAGLGASGLPALVAALHSDRAPVARMALVLLERQLDEWQLLSSRESSPRVAQMAKHLARQSHRRGPYAASATRQLALRLLLWPLDRRVADGDQLAADCEMTLRAGGEAMAAMTDQTREPTLSRDPRHGEEREEAAVLVNPPAVPPLVTSRSSTLVAEASPAPLVSVSRPDVALSTPRSREPGVRAGRSDESREGEVLLLAPPRPSGPATPDGLLLSPSVSDASPVAEGQPSPIPAPAEMETLPTIEVLRLLRDQDALLAGKAREELQRRGFQPLHFRLAEMLLDERAAVRVELAQLLPQLSGMDARPWLIWLSQDAEAEVRRASVAIIATSADPALRQHLRGLEQQETDDAVLRLVRQVLYPSRTLR